MAQQNPLPDFIREEDFWHVQQILDMKKENHWRVRPEHERRFTYSGFLRCGSCGNLIYTHAHRPRDWYVCNKEPEQKRKRVLEAYFDNLVDRIELDRRLKEMETDRQFCEQKLLSIETETYEISAEELAIVFTPLQEWEFLSRSDKRRLLRAIVPEIHLQNYDVTKIALLVQEPHRDEINHTGAGYFIAMPRKMYIPVGLA